MPPARVGLLAAFLILTLGTTPDTHSSGIGDQEQMEIPGTALELGRSLYERGLGVEGREIRGRLGNGVELTGSTTACANCHGRDGRGSVEGGLRAPDIRWTTLTDRYAPVRQGLLAVPYDRSSLRQTLLTGHRPDGTLLDPAMPRVDLTESEVAALVEQLIALSAPTSPPFPSRPVVRGLVPQFQQDRIADQFVRIVERCPETVRPHPIASIRWVRYRDPDEALRQLEEIRVREGTLLLVAPFLVGWEDRFAERTSSWSLTVVLPFAFRNPRGSEGWLYRLPGIERQVERLVETAAQRGAGGVTVVIDPHDRLSVHLGAVADQMAAALGLSVTRWPERPETNDQRLEQPLLWLRNTKRLKQLLGHTVPRAILIPSLFYDPSNVPRGGRWAKTEWSVAYPYNPRETSTGRWQAPAAVWGAAACHVLAALANDGQTGEFSLPVDLAPLPLVIPPRQSDAEARAMVGLITNPHIRAR